MKLRNVLLAGLGGLGLTAGPGLAQQIIPDTTLGASLSQVSPEGDRILGGLESDINLFHSFEEFGIASGQRVDFIVENPVIENIFSRVTGTKRSDISGTLGTVGSFGGVDVPVDVNLFLINPNGILFESEAELNVGASFTASTASGIRFGEQGVFSAVNLDSPALLTVQPSSFIFQGPTPPEKIRVETARGVNLNVDDLTFESAAKSLDLNNMASSLGGLSVSPESNLTLLGGEIELADARVTALGGRLELGAIAGAGEVALQADGSLSFPNDLALADISLTQESEGIVAARGGGDIAVTARNLNFQDGSALIGGILPFQGTTNVPAGDIIIRATGDVVLEQTSGISNDIKQNSIGTGGNLQLDATSLTLREGSVLTTGIFGEGNGGNIRVNIDGLAQLDGVVPNDGFLASGIGSIVNPNAVGNAGRVEVSVGELVLTNGATINTGTFGQGNGGELNITVDGTAKLDGFSPDSPLASGIFSLVYPAGQSKLADTSIVENFDEFRWFSRVSSLSISPSE